MVEQVKMREPMNFQVVVLAGGTSKQLFPLVSKEVPKALLLVGNRPLLSYTLELLEASNIKNLIIVVASADAAVQVRGWISGAYDDRLFVEVVATAEDVGTADALRAVSHRLTAEHILVISGDLVCDVPLGAVAATHCRKRASMTALLCAHQAAGASEGSSASGGKEKAKQQSSSDIIGLDPSRQFLTFLASASQIDKELQIQRSILRAFGRVELHTDLVDAHLYVFRRTIVQEVLMQRPGIHSIKKELVPYLVRSQLRLKSASLGTTQTDDNGEALRVLEKSASSQLLQIPLEQAFLLQGKDGTLSNHTKCCAYIVNKDRYCARVNSVQAFTDINQDVAGDRAIHITGYEVSKNNNVIHPTAKLGYKSTVGPHCMLGEGSELGDKCSIKRSIVGRHCRIGSGVKIMNSVVMDYVTIEDGCQVQGSVICSNAHLQERVILKDCQVGPAYTVATGELQGEALAKRERT
eukprot:c6841_g1_i1 orf=417-1817(-)